MILIFVYHEGGGAKELDIPVELCELRSGYFSCSSTLVTNDRQLFLFKAWCRGRAVDQSEDHRFDSCLDVLKRPGAPHIAPVGRQRSRHQGVHAQNRRW